MNALLDRHKTIALDTSIFIYHFEANTTYLELTTLVLERIQSGQCRGIVSELTLHELLVRPLKLGQYDVADEYELLLANFPHLHLSPVSRHVLVKAAEVRAAHGFRAPDAIIIATALQGGATLLVTNDVQWKRIRELDVVCLDDVR